MPTPTSQLYRFSIMGGSWGDKRLGWGAGDTPNPLLHAVSCAPELVSWIAYNSIHSLASVLKRSRRGN